MNTLYTEKLSPGSQPQKGDNVLKTVQNDVESSNQKHAIGFDHLLRSCYCHPN